MSLTFGEIFLYSQKPEKLYHFLSFLLDVEAESYENEKIIFEFSSIKFIILLDEQISLSDTRAFSLKVATLDELIALKQNIEFYYYKEGSSIDSLKLNDEQLNFVDPDGRAWCVEVAQPINILTHTVENKSTNVRIC